MFEEFGRCVNYGIQFPPYILSSEVKTIIYGHVFNYSADICGDIFLITFWCRHLIPNRNKGIVIN